MESWEEKKNKRWETILRNIRAEAGMTQQEFAEELGVSISSVANWEGGICKPGRMARERVEAFKLNRLKKKKRTE